MSRCHVQTKDYTLGLGMGSKLHEDVRGRDGVCGVGYRVYKAWDS